MSRVKRMWTILEPYIGLFIVALVAFATYQVYDYTQCFTQFNRQVVESQRAVRIATDAEQEANKQFVLEVVQTNNDVEEAQALKKWIIALERVSRVLDNNPYPTYKCSELFHD